LPNSLNDDYLFCAEAGTYESGEVSLDFVNPNAHTVTFRALPGASVTVGPYAAAPDMQTFYIYDGSNHEILENLTILGGTEDAVLSEDADTCVVRGCYIIADAWEGSSISIRATATG
jgi:hypothetical protein